MSLILITPWIQSLTLSSGGQQWLALALLLLLASFRREIEYKGLFSWACLCLLACCAISTVKALEMVPSISGTFSVHRGGILQVFSLMLLVHLYNKEDAPSLKVLISLMGGIMGVACIYQYISIQFGASFDPHSGRAYGLHASPIYSGAFMAGAIPCIVGRGLEASWKRKLCLSLCILGILATQSRGCAVAGLIGALAVYFPRKWAWSAFCLSSIALMLFIWRPDAAQKEVGRQLTHRVAISAIKTLPVHGVGLSNFAFCWLSTRGAFRAEWDAVYRNHFQDHSHNLILEVALSVGFVGFFFFIVAFCFMVPDLRGWQLGVTLSIMTYSLLNPIALPTQALAALAIGCSRNGRGIGKAYALAGLLLLVPLWQWSHEHRLRTGTYVEKIDAALALGLIDKQ